MIQVVAVSPEIRQQVEAAQETGALTCLTTLPIKSKGFNLPKQEFPDAIYPTVWLGQWKVYCQCSCSSSFDAAHTMKCMAGYVAMTTYAMKRKFVTTLQ